MSGCSEVRLESPVGLVSLGSSSIAFSVTLRSSASLDGLLLSPSGGIASISILSGLLSFFIDRSPLCLVTSTLVEGGSFVIVLVVVALSASSGAAVATWPLTLLAGVGKELVALVGCCEFCADMVRDEGGDDSEAAADGARANGVCAGGLCVVVGILDSFF